MRCCMNIDVEGESMYHHLSTGWTRGKNNKMVDTDKLYAWIVRILNMLITAQDCTSTTL